MLQAAASALLTSNPELGPSPVSVSVSPVNANVKTRAEALCTAEFMSGSHTRRLTGVFRFSFVHFPELEMFPAGLLVLLHVHNVSKSRVLGCPSSASPKNTPGSHVPVLSAESLDCFHI